MIKAVFLLLITLSPFAANAARYVFEGVNYNNVNGPNYTEDMRINGFIEFDQQLEPTTSYFADNILNYSFNDGVQTLNQSNSIITGASLRTNEIGLPFFYTLVFTKAPITNTVGEPFSEMVLNFGFNTEGFERNETGYTGTCQVPGKTTCSSVNSSLNSGAYINPGPLPNWSFAGVVVTQPVPVNNPFALLILMSIFMLVFFKYTSYLKASSSRR